MTYDLLLMLHFIGLALGVGTSFAMMTLAASAQKLEPEERGKFMLRASILGKNGSIGFLLLIASGIGLLLDRGIGATFMRGGGAFHAKLLLVVILAGLLGYTQVLAKRARQGHAQESLAKLAKIGPVMLVLGVAIVILAVLAFH